VVCPSGEDNIHGQELPSSEHDHEIGSWVTHGLSKDFVHTCGPREQTLEPEAEEVAEYACNDPERRDPSVRISVLENPEVCIDHDNCI